MFGLLNSAIAISAALRMAWPATPALPAADSGRMNPALTWPVPMDAASGVCGDCGGVEDRYWEVCEQPANNAPAVLSRLATVWRRVGQPAEPETCNCADPAVLPPAAPGARNGTLTIRHCQSDI